MIERFSSRIFYDQTGNKQHQTQFLLLLVDWAVFSKYLIEIYRYFLEPRWPFKVRAKPCPAPFEQNPWSFEFFLADPKLSLFLQLLSFISVQRRFFRSAPAKSLPQLIAILSLIQVLVQSIKSIILQLLHSRPKVSSDRFAACSTGPSSDLSYLSTIFDKAWSNQDKI